MEFLIEEAVGAFEGIEVYSPYILNISVLDI